AMIDHFPESDAKWIFRCQIDLSTPNQQVLDTLLPSIKRYDAAIFHMREYVPRAGGLPPCYIWPPAIDPLAPKNMALSPEDAAYIVDQFGIDVERPLLTQVSRFDPWKDPLGVIDAYRIVKQRFPDVQLALVGSMAHDDPEGWDYYNQTVEYAAGDPDVYILSNLNNVGSVEVNAFQVHSSAVLQKSIREGFGLTVTEALWKTRPTVAGRVGGIVTQIQDGETGWLVDSSAECAEACIEILRDPREARQRALRGKEYVRRNFLTPRLLRNWLVLFNRLLGNDTSGAEVAVVSAAS
ncbi:MAG: glycosyltransferase, partial [Acidobacteria bacterium]|nr:glycosyltransferase [Acidobacteriota bacterium]